MTLAGVLGSAFRWLWRLEWFEGLGVCFLLDLAALVTDGEFISSIFNDFIYRLPVYMFTSLLVRGAHKLK